MPWITIGDFNAVLYSHERSKGAVSFTNKDAAFGRWFKDMKLVDFGFSGPGFSWVRGASVDTFTGARLDRAVGNLKWCEEFPNTKVMHLPRIQSDHCPVFASWDGLDNRLCN